MNKGMSRIRIFAAVVTLLGSLALTRTPAQAPCNDCQWCDAWWDAYEDECVWADCIYITSCNAWSDGSITYHYDCWEEPPSCGTAGCYLTGGCDPE
jgi:hypothetical protein